MYRYSRIATGAVAPDVVASAERGLIEECGEGFRLYFFVADAANDPAAEFETDEPCPYIALVRDGEGEVWINAALDSDGALACARAGAFIALKSLQGVEVYNVHVRTS
ncbi:hypothetical protein [Streptomyces sp. AcH 505]|uniref:hypothetical protein n=1 Tax=Streptomyces sp. AcH 505 TaxID=352211 RepID=UPI0012FEFF4D